MFRARENSDKPPKCTVRANFGLVRRERRNRRLFSYDKFQLRNEVHNQRSIRTQRLTKVIPPFAQLSFRLTQKGTDQALESLRYGGVRNIAFEPVELAGRE